MKRPVLLTFVAVAVFLIAVVLHFSYEDLHTIEHAGACIKSADNQPHVVSSQVESHTPVGNVAQTVHKDPVTGKFTSSPERTQLLDSPDPLQNSLSTSFEGLEEIPSPVANGGMMVRLNGRFQNISTAVKDEDGKLSTTCESGSHATHHHNHSE